VCIKKVKTCAYTGKDLLQVKSRLAAPRVPVVWQSVLEWKEGSYSQRVYACMVVWQGLLKSKGLICPQWCYVKLSHLDLHAFAHKFTLNSCYFSFIHTGNICVGLHFNAAFTYLPGCSLSCTCFKAGELVPGVWRGRWAVTGPQA